MRRRIGALLMRTPHPMVLTMDNYLGRIVRIYDSNKSVHGILDTVDIAYARYRKIVHVSILF